MKSPPIFTSFKDYVTAYPKAEKYRNMWFSYNDEKHMVVRNFLPCNPKNPNLMIGNYICAYVSTWERISSVVTHDCDSRMWRKTCSSREEAEKELEILKGKCPISIPDLWEKFGYTRE